MHPLEVNKVQVWTFWKVTPPVTVFVYLFFFFSFFSDRKSIWRIVMDPDPKVMIMIYCGSFVTEIWEKTLLSSWKPS